MTALKPVQRARLRMFRFIPSQSATAVERADLATSMTDARTALCLALGVPIEDIHPAAGTNITFAAYERSRQSWLTLVADTGWTEWVATHCAKARERWAQVRPEYLEKLPWPAPGIDPELSAWADRRLAEENAGITDSWKEDL